MRVLVTGGAGYIGSHAVLCLLEAGHEVLVVDNLSNSSSQSLVRVRSITGREVALEVGDLRDTAWTSRTVGNYRPEVVLHFAGLKAVGESVSEPVRYYENNVSGTISLLQAMESAGVNKIVFSSSATVYDTTSAPPYSEDCKVGPTNPYGHSKLMAERILTDYVSASPGSAAMSLRYFNPVGAHPSGLIGEDPMGIPNNLMPLVCRVAVGRMPKLSVFGGDYPTPDGTGIRDYIHVMDLAEGHLAALNHVAGSAGGATAVNLGTGTGHSVLELVRAFEKASGRPIPWEIVARRAGDCAESVSDPSLARRLIGWTARRGLDEMSRDAWRWQQSNPNGYALAPDPSPEH